MKFWPIIIPYIKIIQRISTIVKDYTLIFGNLCHFWRYFVLLHFNQILREFMIIFRNSKLISTFFNLIRYNIKENNFSISININNVKFLSNISLKIQDFLDILWQFTYYFRKFNDIWRICRYFKEFLLHFERIQGNLYNINIKFSDFFKLN
jgi:hypothetical protein